MWRRGFFGVGASIFQEIRSMSSLKRVPAYIYPGSEDLFIRSYEAYQKAQNYLKSSEPLKAKQSIQIAIDNATVISGDTPAVASYVRQLRDFQRSIQNLENQQTYLSSNISHPR